LSIQVMLGQDLSSSKKQHLSSFFYGRFVIEACWKLCSPIAKFHNRVFYFDTSPQEACMM